ncbi:MAG: fatty acyl-AMP ligase, partial [Candidatus Hydrogenedentes bacterium]|nr:fatty acyl-AMP ligase [Candidatus Hydrogenedentota bacterium]
MTQSSRTDCVRVEPAINEASLLEDWAQHGRTLVEVLRTRATQSPDKLALTFLVDGEEEGDRYTYADLDRRARAIAVDLLERCTQGDRVLLLYPPGLDYIAAFYGCLYAGIVAVPVSLPDLGRLNRSLPRLKIVAQDADAKFALTVSSISQKVKSLVEHHPDSGGFEWVATDTMPEDLAARWTEPAIASQSIAFLQYTSGSTSDPKGVMVTHQNLLYNIYDMGHRWEGDTDNCVVTWLPAFHDMGLIYGQLMPVYMACPCYIMSPLAFLQRPYRWLNAISKYRATLSAAPNFAFDLCVRKITAEQRATLDLSSWRNATNGAEPVRADTLQRFAENFKSCGFRWDSMCPGYGLAEATLMVSTTAKLEPTFLKVVPAELELHRVVEAKSSTENARVLVGCGRTSLDTRVIIVDPETRLPCRPDRVGEIWISGTTVAPGYWNRPKETRETFGARLADTGEGPYLRTGDLGFVKDDILFVTGRIKDMI